MKFLTLLSDKYDDKTKKRMVSEYYKIINTE